MARRARLAAIVLSAALAAGCFEGKADFTFNPDGSGKVVGEILFPTRPPWLPVRRTFGKTDTPPPPLSTEDEMKECVTQIIKRSSGIDAWKDVSFERAADGRVRLKATLYFKDLTKVRFYPDDRSRLTFGPDGTNALLLILSRAKPVAEPPKPSHPVTPEDAAKRMKDMRERYAQAKAAVTIELALLKVNLAFRTPGTLEEARGLEQQGTTLSYAIEGPKIAQAMDAQMADGTYLKQLILAGKSATAKDMMNEKVFGLKGEVWARWKEPFKARFDYPAEANAARKAQPQMMLKLGLDKPRPSASPAPVPAPAPAPVPAKDTQPPKKDATPAKKPPDAPSAKGLPGIPMPDPTKIPAPILPF